MADYKILFKGSDDCKNDSLECFEMNGRLYVAIYPDSQKIPVFIALDKSTAIKFSKEIRRQIYLMGDLIWNTTYTIQIRLMTRK